MINSNANRENTLRDVDRTMNNNNNNHNSQKDSWKHNFNSFLISLLVQLSYWTEFITSIISMKATKVTRDKETKYKQTFMENEDIFFANAT